MLVESVNGALERTPLVSIFCASYNHENFIAQAIEGFLMQKTNFPFEIIITEDKSTDSTAQIIKEYESKYPEKFVVFYHKENLYSQKIDFFQTEVLPVIKGKYIAWCEGDDYWTDPHKLQEQVDFLEANPECSLVCHRYEQYDQENNISFSDNQDEYFTNTHINGFLFDSNFVFKKHWITKTLTLLFKKEILNITLLTNYKNMRDTILIYYLLNNHKGYCFNQIWGVYRLHNGGICSKVSIQSREKDAYNIYKELYLHEKTTLTRHLYLNQYCNYFYYSKGLCIFHEEFNLLRLVSLLYYIPVKLLKILISKFD